MDWTPYISSEEHKEIAFYWGELDPEPTLAEFEDAAPREILDTLRERATLKGLQYVSKRDSLPRTGNK